MASINFTRCSNTAYDNVSRDDITEYLRSLKENDIMQLHQQLEKYIASEFHISEQCSCELNHIGTIFADCIKDSLLLGGWTGLHIAVADDNPRYKKQAIDAFIVAFPELLFTKNNKGQTPLMLAAKTNVYIIVYLVEKYIITSDDRKRARWCNDSRESVLTFSFDLKEQRKIMADSEDISMYLIRNLHDGKIDIMDLKKAVCSQNCPNEVIVEISNCLSGSIDLRHLSDILGKLITKTGLDVSQFCKILINIENISPYKFSDHEAMYTKDFNILKELAKTVSKRGDGVTTTILFSTFYTNFLKYSCSCVYAGDQKNITHFACQEDNVFLLEILAKKFQDEFMKMMTLYDSDNKRPAYYCRKPIKVVTQLSCFKADPDIWTVLCKDNKYNIIHQIFKRSVVAKDLKELFKLEKNLLKMLLQNCNNNSDSALHLMLQIRCKLTLLEMMVAKFTELNISVDVRNDKGMTPLLVLCSFLSRYDSLDIPTKLVKVLSESGADHNIIIGSEVLSQFSAPGKLITTEWLARMSIHTADDREKLSEDFQKFLPIIKRSPEYEDGEFEADNELFEKLRSHDPIKYSHQQFKIINLIGPYTCAQFPDESIVCLYQTIESIFYCCNGLQPNCSVTYIHSTFDIHTDLSVVVHDRDVFSCILHQKDKLQSLSKKQINLLTLLKSKLGLSYLYLPAGFISTGTVQEDVSYLAVDESVSLELGYDLAALYQDLDSLSKIGVISLVKLDEEVHVMNMPVALTQSDNGHVQALLYCSGIPANILAEDPRIESKCEEVLFNITIGSIGEETSGEYMLKPFSDLLTYLLSGKLARKDLNCYRVLLSGKTLIELSVDKKKITITASNASLRGRVLYAAQIAASHFNQGNLGVLRDDSNMNIVFRLPGDPEDGDILATSTSAPLLPGTEVDGNTDTRTNVQIEKKLSTNLGGLDVRYLKILFQKMVEDRSLKIPVDEARAPLKSHIETVKFMRLYSELVNEHRDCSLINFYNTVKKDPKNDRFCEALLEVLGLEEEHMKTRLESCQDNAWWAVTAVVAGILLVLTIVLSVLYDVDAGFGGIAGVPLVFVASWFLKRIVVRDEQTGKFNPWKDQEVMQLCKNCMA